MTALLIDGLPAPAPAALRTVWTPIGTRERTAAGSLALEHRGFKRLVSLSWVNLSPLTERELRQALTAQPFFTLRVPFGAGLEEEIVCCLISYEKSLGPSPAGVPLTAETVRAELEER